MLKSTLSGEPFKTSQVLHAAVLREGVMHALQCAAEVYTQTRTLRLQRFVVRLAPPDRRFEAMLLGQTWLLDAHICVCTSAAALH